MKNPLDYCTAFIGFILIIVAICGPVYAFVFMSCVSTLPCNVRSLTARIGAVCTEATPLDDATVMFHGDRCTLLCLDEDFEPSQPELLCVDGASPGEETVRCQKRRIFIPAKASGLVKGAVTDGELRDACVRASNLACDGTPGGTAILLQMQNLTMKICQDLLEECKVSNSEFAFMVHTTYNDDTLMGQCGLGCYMPQLAKGVLPGSATAYLPGPTLPPLGFQPPAATSTAPLCPGMPMCVNVNTSCNAEDNGDYYRFPTCASGQSQWTMMDKSRRIRYDSQPQYAQGGKWILEGPVNPETSSFGQLHARQPSFDMEPVFGPTRWEFSCKVGSGVDVANTMYRYEDRVLELAECTCDLRDCSGNGEAIGSKTFGPDCTCKCFEGFEGKKCEIKLCKAPGVLYAPVPPCEEGKYIPAGGVCTPICNDNYVPNREIFNCPDDALGLVPSDFECMRAATVALLSPEAEAAMFGAPRTTTPIPDCSPLDCSWRGLPTGPMDRRRDGTCICECFANFTGEDCNTQQFNCLSPTQLSVPFSDQSPCVEGLLLTTVCNAQCEEGYYPMPQQLRCTYDGLSPPTFGCYGGPDPREVWCAIMKNIAIVATVLASLSLFTVCFYQKGAFERLVEGFMHHDVAIDVEEDEEGKYYVVHPDALLDGTETNVPERIRQRTAAVNAQVAKDKLAITNGTYTSHSLLFVPDTLIAVEEEEQLDALEANRATTGPARALRSDGMFDMDIVRDQFQGMQRQVSFGEGFQETDVENQADLADSALRSLANMLGNEESGGSCGSTAVPTAQEIVVATAAGNPPSALDLIAASSMGFTSDAHEPAPKRAVSKELVPDPGRRALIKTQPDDISWSMKLVQLETDENERRRLEGIRRKNDANKEGADAAAGIKALLQETAQEREDIDTAIRDALKAGDGEALRASCKRGKAMLEIMAGVPPGPRANLTRMVQIAESRVEQFDERAENEKSAQHHQDRIARGEAPDWNITPEQLWRYVRECNVAKVRAGMRAKLPVQTKSKDGKRFTVMHIALQESCKEGMKATDEDRLLVIEALLKAKANPNAADNYDRTPLDLAFAEGMDGAEFLPIVGDLRRLGFRTLAEAGAEAASKKGTMSPTSLGSPASPMSPGREEASPKAGTGPEHKQAPKGGRTYTIDASTFAAEAAANIDEDFVFSASAAAADETDATPDQMGSMWTNGVGTANVAATIAVSKTKGGRSKAAPTIASMTDVNRAFS